MAGMGSYSQILKMMLHNSLFKSLGLAVVIHLALLSTQLDIVEVSKVESVILGVTLQLDQDKKTPYIIENQSQEPQNEIVSKVKNIEPPSKKEIVKDHKTESEPNKNPIVSISSDGFNQFLRSEASRDASDSATKRKQLDEFSTTFKPNFEPPVVKPDSTYRDFQGQLGGGQYKVSKNGKVTCLLKMVPLSFDDHVYGAGGGAKNCTPKKKLDIKLRKNTRE